MAQLTPSQNAAYNSLKLAMNAGSLLYLRCPHGRGRTTILRKLRTETGGAFITAKDFIAVSGTRHPLSLEETLDSVVAAALDDHEIVYVDDIDLVHEATSGCHFYPRGHYLETAVLSLCELVFQANKKLVVSTGGPIGEAFAKRSFGFSIPRFSPADYSALLKTFLDEKGAEALDSEKIFRFAPKLNAHQLKAACEWLRPGGAITTEQFIEYLRSQRLASNVDLTEVQEVDLAELRGVDDVIRSLEIHIVLPLSDSPIAAEIGLRPKRGVLLYGPPGTGKTTIGRALAHRLRGKFFLIDGTFIAGTNQFYQRIHQVFEAAKENSPAVIFIDDADAIFEDGEERGLYRYLLTKLDGLESEGTARVCVMMTAMNLQHLPPALVRSGRVELWLEMRLPDRDARREIFKNHLIGVPEDLLECDVDGVLSATEGFTGADMKGLVADAKGLYAFERASGQTLRTSTEYFLESAASVRENKERYERAEQAARSKVRTGNQHHFFAPEPSSEEE